MIFSILINNKKNMFFLSCVLINMSNKNFKNISSGTPGAFNTGFVAKSGVVGKESGPSVKSPFTIIDVTVDVGALGTVFPVIFSLGDAIPAGSVITQASVNGRGSIKPGANATYQLGLSATSTGAIEPGEELAPLAAAVAAGTPPGVTGQINAGIVTATALTVVKANYPHPVLVVANATDTVGNLNVKIVYFSA
jgi:hypothetical protein